MIVTRRIAVRIALILLVAAILQVSFFSFLNLLGSSPDVIPVVVVCLGLLGGAVAGAVCGFAAGFLVDSLLLQTLGVSSLVLLSIGYLAGRYREGAEVPNRWMPALLAGGLTLLGAAGFTAIQLMLGVDTPVSLLIVREILVQSLLATLLALAVYPLIRRVLAPALIDHEPKPRRLLVRGMRRRRGRRRPLRSRAAGGDAGVSHRGARRRSGSAARRSRLPGSVR
jgi:rod shape-determining protein MreD